jgi:hypothetical protein
MWLKMVHYVCWPFTFTPISCLQIFSIDMKAIGGSLVTLVSWLGSFAISYSFSFLMDWSSAGNAPIPLGLTSYSFLLVNKKKEKASLLRNFLSQKLTFRLNREDISFLKDEQECTLHALHLFHCSLYVGTFFMFSAASLITILFVAKLVPETKGRTLEEIQDSLNSRR